MKRLDYYVIGVTLLAVSGYYSLNGKLSRLEEQIAGLSKNIQMAQIRRPASYFGASNNNNIFKVTLEVLTEGETVPGNPDVKPPLTGHSYFSKTSDDVGFYIFTRNPLLHEDDKITGWFSYTGLSIHNNKYDKDFSVIIPIYVE